jgi:hypothetical protein
MKLIASLAVALSVLAVGSARAQQVTNGVTLSFLFIPQGPTNSVDGTNTFYAPAKTLSYNSPRFLEELSNVLHAQQGVNLTSAAKLVLLTGGNQPPLFAVVDGTNFYSLAHIMMLNFPLQTAVTTGTQNAGTRLAFPAIKAITMVQVVYNDSPILGSDAGLAFILQGIQSSSTTDTVPAAGTEVYTETFSARLSNLAGEVTQSNVSFYATGTMSASGKGTLVLH